MLLSPYSRDCVQVHHIERVVLDIVVISVCVCVPAVLRVAAATCCSVRDEGEDEETQCLLRLLFGSSCSVAARWRTCGRLGKTMSVSSE